MYLFWNEMKIFTNISRKKRNLTILSFKKILVHVPFTFSLAKGF